MTDPNRHADILITHIKNNIINITDSTLTLGDYTANVKFIERIGDMNRYEFESAEECHKFKEVWREAFLNLCKNIFNRAAQQESGSIPESDRFKYNYMTEGGDYRVRRE